MARLLSVLLWAASASATLNLAHFRSDFAGGFSQVSEEARAGDGFVKRQTSAPKFLNENTRSPSVRPRADVLWLT